MPSKAITLVRKGSIAAPHLIHHTRLVLQAGPHQPWAGAKMSYGAPWERGVGVADTIPLCNAKLLSYGAWAAYFLLLI